MANDPLLYVGQKAFIEKEGHILVLQDPNIGVDFPGGKLNEQELDSADITRALQREVEEETGLVIDVGQIFHAWVYKFPPSPNHKSNYIYMVGFLCRYISGDVNLSHEHASYKWVNAENYTELNDGTPHYKALEHYFKTR